MQRIPAAFPPEDPTFIPDGVRSSDPPAFVEVKRYDASMLQPSSNAGAQVRYLMDWADRNPTGPAPSFELWISNDDNLSPAFRRLLAQADGAGIELLVNGQPWAR